MKAIVAGAGVAGCLTALALRRCGAAVTLYSASTAKGNGTCSFNAAGMLSPMAEALYGHLPVALAGWDAVDRWQNIISTLDGDVSLGRQGSLVVAGEGQKSEWNEWRQKLLRKFPRGPWRELQPTELTTLEPGLADMSLYTLELGIEGYVESRAAIAALLTTFKREGGQVYLEAHLDHVDVGVVFRQGEREAADVVVDCRGLAAKKDLPTLRGVRGEAFIVHAPEVYLTRPIRVLHSRYPIYVVPRGNSNYYIGATALESESPHAITVKALLELLTGLHQFHPGFRYASVVETIADVRPAFDDQLPSIIYEPGLLTLNGLFRHGFLLAPILSEAAKNIIYQAPLHAAVKSLVKAKRRAELAGDNEVSNE